jgi:hypothetical protein
MRYSSASIFSTSARLPEGIGGAIRSMIKFILRS